MADFLKSCYLGKIGGLFFNNASALLVSLYYVYKLSHAGIVLVIVWFGVTAVRSYLYCSYGSMSVRNLRNNS